MVKLPFSCGCSQDASLLTGLVPTRKYCNLHLGDLWPSFLPAPPTSPAWEMLHGSCFSCCITHTHPSPHGQQYVPLCGCHWQSKNPSDIQRRSMPEGETSGPCTEWSPTPSSPYTESETAPGKQVTAPMPTLRHCRVVGLITWAPDANSPCGMALSVWGLCRSKMRFFLCLIETSTNVFLVWIFLHGTFFDSCSLESWSHFLSSLGSPLMLGRAIIPVSHMRKQAHQDWVTCSKAPCC